MLRFDNVVYLPSGNTARDFSVRDLGNGRVRIQYVYTDRRRAHQVSRSSSMVVSTASPIWIA